MYVLRVWVYIHGSRDMHSPPSPPPVPAMLRRHSSPAGPSDDTRRRRPRFHTTLPNSPALYHHSIVSLPSPSRSGPESPANASDVLKDILERQSNSQPRSRSEGVKVTNDASRDDGDAWKGVERRKWDMRYSSKPGPMPNGCADTKPLDRSSAASPRTSTSSRFKVDYSPFSHITTPAAAAEHQCHPNHPSAQPR